MPVMNKNFVDLLQAMHKDILFKNGDLAELWQIRDRDALLENEIDVYYKAV